MKYILLSFFLLCNTIVFGQTKEDILACLELIFEQDEFQVAFENDITSSGAVVMEINPNRGYNDNSVQAIKSQLTQDDFYDFDRPVEILIIGNRQNPDTPKHYYLDFLFGGDKDNLRFNLWTVTRDDNMYCTWMYSLVKKFDEWEIVGRNLDKREHR